MNTEKTASDESMDKIHLRQVIEAGLSYSRSEKTVDVAGCAGEIWTVGGKDRASKPEIRVGQGQYRNAIASGRWFFVLRKFPHCYLCPLRAALGQDKEVDLCQRSR